MVMAAIPTAKCPKCKGKMMKSGGMTSGNSKYIVMKCDNCSFEKMECSGVL